VRVVAAHDDMVKWVGDMDTFLPGHDMMIAGNGANQTQSWPYGPVNSEDHPVIKLITVVNSEAHPLIRLTTYLNSGGYLVTRLPTTLIRQHPFLIRLPPISPSLLVVDDFGWERLSTEQAHGFYEIVAERCERNSTIITSNRHITEWGNLFDDSILANSALYRLAHNAHQRIVEGESYRQKKAIKRNIM
jgi:hypothetical protein